MDVILLPSAVSPEGAASRLFLTSYLVNGRVAIDAGSLGLYGSPGEQARVRHVLISHSHMDHVATLPVFLENTYERGAEPVTVHGSEAVLDSLRRDFFNNRVWPDLFALGGDGERFVRLRPLQPLQPLELEGLRLTPIPVDHVVPTLGLLIEDRDSAVLIVSDTGPTEAIWRHASAAPNLRAVFLEASFPNSMAWLADVSKHLTPEGFGREARKLTRPAKFLAVHVKARFHDQVVAELEALGLPDLEIAQPGKVYRF